MLLKNIEKNLEKILTGFDFIGAERAALLIEFAAYIFDKRRRNETVKLNFICTHNSRRSHMSQIWAQAAAEYYKIDGVECYSGGTEATAFNPRAVKAAQNCGFDIMAEDGSPADNPVYLVKYSDSAAPLRCFSKVYNDPFNPGKAFAAIMTCSDADENCPVVPGAERRFPIRYEDPKISDGTPTEEEKYKERFGQIGTEMLFVFSNVRKLAN